MTFKYRQLQIYTTKRTGEDLDDGAYHFGVQ